MVKKRDKRNQAKKRKIHFCHHRACHSNLKKSKAMKAHNLARHMHAELLSNSRVSWWCKIKKSSEGSRRCRICGTYSEGDELVCLFCGGLVDAPVESDSGDSNPDGWRFSFSRSFFSFFFSLLLCFFLQGDSYWWVAIFSWYVLVRVSLLRVQAN